MRTSMLLKADFFTAMMFFASYVASAQATGVAIVDDVTGGNCEVCPVAQGRSTPLKKGAQLQSSDKVRCVGKGRLSATYIETGNSFVIEGDVCKLIGLPGADEREDLKQQKQGRGRHA